MTRWSTLPGVQETISLEKILSTRETFDLLHQGLAERLVCHKVHRSTLIGLCKQVSDYGIDTLQALTINT
jgi:hypothetical protein